MSHCCWHGGHSPAIRERFPDGVFWTTLGQEPQLTSLLTAWIRATAEDQSASWSIESASNYLRTYFHDRVALIIIDDAWTDMHVRPFLVGGPKCSVLITTRRGHIIDSIGGDTVHLDVMTPPEAVGLLAKRSKSALSGEFPNQDAAHAERLVRELGYLPLAIELVGSLLGRGYDWNEVLGQLLDVSYPVSGSAHYTSRSMQRIEKSLSLSLEALAREDRAAWEAFLRLSLLPFGQPITGRMCAHILGETPSSAENILGTLFDDALLTKNTSSYVMHSILQDLGRRWFASPLPVGLGQDVRQGHDQIIANYRRVALESSWVDLPDDGYIHAHMAWHLKQADRSEDLFDLLLHTDRDGRNTWFRAKYKLGQISSYVDDLQLALEVIRLQTSPNLVVQSMLSLAIASVETLTDRISPEVFHALVAARFWTVIRAYQWCERISNLERRRVYMLALASAIGRRKASDDADHRDAELLKKAALDSAMRNWNISTLNASGWQMMARSFPSLIDTYLNPITKSAFDDLKGIRRNEFDNNLAVGEFFRNLPNRCKGVVFERMYAHLDSEKSVLIRSRALANLIPFLERADQTVWCEKLIDWLEEWRELSPTLLPSPLNRPPILRPTQSNLPSTPV
jgi:hypothetical protein